MIFSYVLICFAMMMHFSKGAVCDEQKLTTELRQDLEDNGILDCMRKIPAPEGVQETEAAKNKRLAA